MKKTSYQLLPLLYTCAHTHVKEVRHVFRDSKHFRNNSEPLVRSQEAALGCMFDIKLITHIFHNSPYIHTHTHTHTSYPRRNTGRGGNDSGQLVSIGGLLSSRRIPGQKIFLVSFPRAWCGGQATSLSSAKSSSL